MASRRLRDCGAREFGGGHGAGLGGASPEVLLSSPRARTARFPPGKKMQTPPNRRGRFALGGGFGGAVGGGLALAGITLAGLRDALQHRAGRGPRPNPLLDLGLDPGPLVWPDHDADREAVALGPALEHGPVVDNPAGLQVFESQKANH